MGLKALFEYQGGGIASGDIINQMTRGNALRVNHGYALFLVGLRPNEVRDVLGPIDQGARFACVDPEAASAPAELGADRHCRDCGCTFYRPCVHPRHGACWWVSSDLCSACGDGWSLSNSEGSADV